MGTKTISIMDDVYELLVRNKKPNESFSDELRRIVSKNGDIMECAGLWADIGDKEAEEMKNFIKEFRIDEKFSLYPKKIRMKLRTLVNFIHLFIAIKEDAYLVSGDKDLIEMCGKYKIYDKVLSYVEFRKLIASLFQHA